MRTVIIGNSGSGKTWLASRLAARIGLTAVHFDDIFWKPDGFDQPRESHEVDALIAEHLLKHDWVAEGVFGSIAAQFLHKAKTLIWLDLEWEICRSRLQARGSQSKRHMTRSKSEAGLHQLLAWAQEYCSRQTSSSYMGHEKLYAAFGGQRYRITSEVELLACLK